MSTGLLSLVYGAVAGAATLAGVWLVSLGREKVLGYSHYLNSFAAGAMLSISLFHLMPHALKHSPDRAFLYIFAGFLAFYLLETFLIFHSGAEIHYGAGQRARARGMVAFWGLFFHSLLDGVIIGVGFGADPSLGIVAALGIILHELPEGITTFSLLLDFIGRKKALVMSTAVALATPLGAASGILGLGAVPGHVMGMLIAVAAGSFLYVAASDLIPETHGEGGVRNAGCLVAGATALYFLSKLVG